jgi:hypothetical protein
MLSLLVSTISWCIRNTSPPYPDGESRCSLAVVVLQLLYLLASNGSVDMEGGGDTTMRYIMTTLGQVIIDLMSTFHTEYTQHNSDQECICFDTFSRTLLLRYCYCTLLQQHGAFVLNREHPHI